MSKISELDPYRDGSLFTKSIMELVTGNPILEESETIKKNRHRHFPVRLSGSRTRVRQKASSSK